MKSFVFGLGGGGDIASTYVAIKYLELRNYSSIVGAVTWERYVEDPIPGPICKEDLVNSNPINMVITEVYRNSYAIRGGQKVIPQLVHFLNATSFERGYSICIRYSPKEIAKGIADFSLKNNIDLIVGVDAGGDVLAKGCEENLGSPLIDFIMLSALVELKEMGFNVILATIGAGSDGELDQDYILKRISEIASNRGLVDIKGIDIYVEKDLEVILSHVKTEASKIPFQAFRGLFGEIVIRNGLRKVKVTPISSIMFFLDPYVVAKTSPLYYIIKDSSSLDDANKRMNEVGIYTEYNFELDLSQMFGRNSANQKIEDIIELRKRGKEKLGKLKLHC